ncbi:MAG: hypothetical protein IPK50_03890 [Fibrobacterota bacterium]|nr:hypothetical protein [Fibrobacterota bacterium]QQS06036.1 MAG: hypothetical protein IPK50_03890 [Fibrobacterota bacterium]
MNTKTISGLVLALAAVSLAQEAAPSKTFGGSGGIAVGIRQMELGKIRSALEDKGFTEPSQTFLSIGGGGQFQRGMWLIGGEGGAWIPAFGSAKRGSDEVQLAGGWGMARAGMDHALMGNLHLIPSLGVGGGGLQMKVSQPSADRFDDLLDGPGEVSTFDKAGLLVEPAITVEWRTFVSGGKENGAFFTVGLRAGYAWNPWSGSWSNAGGEVQGAPDVDLGGPSVRLVVGMGGCSARK